MQYFWEKDYVKYDRVYSDKIWWQFVGKVKRFMALANKTGTPKQKRVEIQNIVLWISLARQFNKSSSDIAASLVSLQIPIYRKSFTWSSWISLLRRASYWLTKTFLLSMSYICFSMTSQRKVQKPNHYCRLAATIKHYAAGGLILMQASFLSERLFTKVLSIPEACSQLSSNNNCLSAKSAQVCHKIFCQRPTVQFITSTS